MQYHICCGETLSELERNVKAHLLDGWAPQGGIACLPQGGLLPGFMLAQAVTKVTSRAPVPATAENA